MVPSPELYLISVEVVRKSSAINSPKLGGPKEETLKNSVKFVFRYTKTDDFITDFHKIVSKAINN